MSILGWVKTGRHVWEYQRPVLVTIGARTANPAGINSRVRLRDLPTDDVRTGRDTSGSDPTRVRCCSAAEEARLRAEHVPGHWNQQPFLPSPESLSQRYTFAFRRWVEQRGRTQRCTGEAPRIGTIFSQSSPGSFAILPFIPAARRLPTAPDFGLTASRPRLISQVHSLHLHQGAGTLTAR